MLVYMILGWFLIFFCSHFNSLFFLLRLLLQHTLIHHTQVLRTQMHRTRMHHTQMMLTTSYANDNDHHHDDVAPQKDDGDHYHYDFIDHYDCR